MVPLGCAASVRQHGHGDRRATDLFHARQAIVRSPRFRSCPSPRLCFPDPQPSISSPHRCPSRWTTSCPGTRAAPSTSATFRPSASAATPPSDGRREAGCVFCGLEVSGLVLLENELALCIADADLVTPGRSLVIPRRHGSDGSALHQPEWNAVVEPIAERKHMSHVVKRFIGARVH
jgi:hypothetical protein